MSWDNLFTGFNVGLLLVIAILSWRLGKETAVDKKYSRVSQATVLVIGWLIIYGVCWLARVFLVLQGDYELMMLAIPLVTAVVSLSALIKTWFE